MNYHTRHLRGLAHGWRAHSPAILEGMLLYSVHPKHYGDSDGARSHNLVIDSHAHSQLCYGAIYKIDFSLNLYVYIILKIYRKIKLLTNKNFVAGATGFEPVEPLWGSLP